MIFGIFIEKVTIKYENHVYCPVTLHLPPPPHPLCRPLGWVLLGHIFHVPEDTFFLQKFLPKLVKKRVDPYHPPPPLFPPHSGGWVLVLEAP